WATTGSTASSSSGSRRPSLTGSIPASSAASGAARPRIAAASPATTSSSTPSPAPTKARAAAAKRKPSTGMAVPTTPTTSARKKSSPPSTASPPAPAGKAAGPIPPDRPNPRPSPDAYFFQHPAPRRRADVPAARHSQAVRLAARRDARQRAAILAARRRRDYRVRRRLARRHRTVRPRRRLHRLGRDGVRLFPRACAAQLVSDAERRRGRDLLLLLLFLRIPGRRRAVVDRPLVPPGLAGVPPRGHRQEGVRRVPQVMAVVAVHQRMRRAGQHGELPVRIGQ